MVNKNWNIILNWNTENKYKIIKWYLKYSGYLNSLKTTFVLRQRGFTIDPSDNLKNAT